MNNTPYDDVFRTLLNDCTNLIIPVINEIFHEHYSGNEEIRFFPNEHFINKPGGNEQERITDSSFLVLSLMNKSYHFECQSTPDGSMLVRIFEYASQVALDNGRIEGDTLTVEFPNSAVLFLRSDKKTPDEMTLCIKSPGGILKYGIPVIKQQNYGIEDIFKKNLLFLLPFYIFSHENKLSEYNKDSTKLAGLTREYQYIRARLEELCQNREINEYTKCTIIDMSEKVLEHLAGKYENVKEGVKAVMGGKVLEYEAKTILNKGRSEGRSEGRAEGYTMGYSEGLVMAYVGLVKDGLITRKEAANRLHMREDELENYQSRGIPKENSVLERLHSLKQAEDEQSNNKTAACTHEHQPEK